MQVRMKAIDGGLQHVHGMCAHACISVSSEHECKQCYQQLDDRLQHVQGMSVHLCITAAVIISIMQTISVLLAADTKSPSAQKDARRHRTKM